MINFVTVVATFLFMEFVAWFTHKYIMHGFLWHLHRDHHTHDNKGVFEKNDYFFLIFATPGILLIIIGAQEWTLPFFIGLGITLYGFAYFFVHDLFIHQRIKILRNTNSSYLKSIRRAHKIHHKNTGKYGGECFGMLLVPRKFF